MKTDVTAWRAGDTVPAPLNLYTCNVESDWVDYNNHMTEAAYLTAFGWASDVLFRYIGITEAYRAAGSSFYTIETHIIYEREAALGEPLRITTQVLDHDGKRLHINHEMFSEDSSARLATAEQMLVHVDTKAARSSAISTHVTQALTAILESHRSLGIPPEVGHTMKIQHKN